MTPKTDYQTRNPPRTSRLSATCYLHPADPATGICASCLRERLHGIDSPGDPEPSFSTGNVGGGSRVVSCLNNADVRSPELRRCRSVFIAKSEASTSSLEPRRKSCDVGARNGKSLAHMFVADDECNGSNGVGSRVESKNILGSPAFELREANTINNGEEIRDFDGNEDDQEENNVEGEFKTMKEYIDLELQSKGQKMKDFKELAGNFWEAASVFSKKLQKWRHKQKKKLSNDGGIGDGSVEMNGKKEKNFGETQSEATEYGVGRRSCDTEPRFSVDAGRISFDEPRASWDGYLIARTIPRLAPMLSVVENAILSNRFENHRISVDGGQMHSILEDETSSGGSAQSQSNSDSSSSQRRSSFDRSSSVRSFGKKFVGLEGDEMKYGLNARASPAKLVITERELKDWHLRSIKDDHRKKKIESPCAKDATFVDDGGHLGSKKKQIGWRKMWTVFGLKQKSCENKFEKSMGDSLDCSGAQACEKQEKEVGGETIDGTGWKIMRSSSILGARRSCEVIRSSDNMMSLADESESANKGREDFVLGRKQSAKYPSSSLDDGVLPFYLTPLRTSRSRKSGRNKLQNSHFINGHILSLN